MNAGEINLNRRRIVASLAFAPAAYFAVPRLVSAQSAAARELPVWTGFGLNGGAGQARFALSSAYVKKYRKMDIANSQAFSWLRDPLAKSLKAMQPPVVDFKDSVEFGERLLVGFAHDYEIAVGARLERGQENANTLMIFMSGVGLVLGFDKSTGWRIASSFPFMVRFERLEPDLRNIQIKAIDKMGDAYAAYVDGFAHFLARFNKWNRGYRANVFARVTRADIHPEARAKLEKLKIDSLLNNEFVGFSASSSICDLLDIPLLPYQENDALAKRYAVKFSDDLRAQDNIAIPDADLQFEVIIRDVDKQVIPSKQMGITIIRRQLVINFRARNAFDPADAKPFFQTFAAAAHDEDKIPHGSTEDDTPERDVVFFDRLLTRTLSFLLRGIAAKDAALLNQASVKYDAVAGAIPKLLELCAKTRG